MSGRMVLELELDEILVDEQVLEVEGVTFQPAAPITTLVTKSFGALTIPDGMVLEVTRPLDDDEPVRARLIPDPPIRIARSEAVALRDAIDAVVDDIQRDLATARSVAPYVEDLNRAAQGLRSRLAPGLFGG